MDKIHISWLSLFDKHNDLINEIFKIINQNDNTPVYPPKDKIFRVFEMDINDIKLVLLGQDPYHGYGQANGLSFSVEKNIDIPPSLKNIYTEIKNNYPEKNYVFEHGDISRWFYEEKIFLLNSSLTVFEGKPNSFSKKWTIFTDDIIKYIVENNKNALFLLLGNYAKEKIKFIKDETRYIYSVHPSPLSAYRGFFGSNIFKKIDDKIDKKIDWSI
jgi:uracil-DNA glycosylase